MLKLFVGGLGLGLIAILTWLSLSLVWYPKFDELDLKALTREADILLASCAEAALGTDKTTKILIPMQEYQTPYIYSLVRDKSRHRCGEGVKLVLWDDFMISRAGIYVSGEQSTLPDDLAPIASSLGGRVYQWHSD